MGRQQSFLRGLILKENIVDLSSYEILYARVRSGSTTYLYKEINILFALTEKGQGMVEQALLIVLVAIVVIAVLMVLEPTIGNVFSSINKSLSSI